MIGFLITLHAIISILLITVVLMQASQGGGLSGISGGQTTNAIFGGRSAGNALSKITTYLAAIFMGLALLISLISSPGSSAASSVVEDAQQDGSLAPSTENLSLPTIPLQEEKIKD
ncbi:MAG: preprotein translocase subunit SecG [Candidatus Neomarinimicrobiota bacterium]|jgi:preprotein translocase subunit SecG|nr:preprotein translocase subunit SecG [Candidatus Neomarinimicrobiota bacterium]MEC9474726.1 preprotein translocase subunit SecG [Candidatus Neomarinimicrobiota bacterium]MED5434112.1 preprotein translocase subunit SecG [Candidatus Neomarinimicrobiota bacterium]MEE3302988.1 preprotein translocase subunit SecG [Candidatus Neomarinimicrobiota bacterium]|tara:strand:- start:718 stop:1065 length:348 start_codon:yes stop_codon:yes gene_type:complete